MTPTRFRAVVAVHLLLLRGERVLLLRRSNTGYEDGNYSVIAGHLDGNETASQAMAREAFEEAGIIVAPADLRFVHVMHRKEAVEADERIDFFFATTRWQGEPTIGEPDKCSELRWVALNALPKNMVPYVRAALEHYRENRAYAEFWPADDADAKEIGVDRDELPLAGGNLSTVVRVGDTVRRPLRPWSAAVHGLLHHLEARGFDGAPRVLGIDERGREILSFIAGEVGAYPLPAYMWSDAVLTGAVRLLRRLHDATLGYVAPDGTAWQFSYPNPTHHEVICHNDVAPYNMVFANGRPRALIDFDTAGPGPRIWDVAYAAYTFVPLASFAPSADGRVVPYEPAPHAAERARRLGLLGEAYGLSIDDLLPTVVRRLEAVCDLLMERAEAGDAAYQRLVADGHLAHYRREVAFVRRHAAEWQLSAG